MNDFLTAVGTFFADMFLYSMAAIFLENTIFSRGIGTSTVMYSVRKKFSILPFGIIITSVITLSSVIAYFLMQLFVENAYRYYILPPLFTGVIGVVYVIGLLVVHRLPKRITEDVLPMIHVGAFNCAVLGALLIASNVGDITVGGFIGMGIGTGIGFTIALLCVSLGYERLSGANIPKAFRGFPITLIYIGIISIAIYGIIGHELPF